MGPYTQQMQDVGITVKPIKKLGSYVRRLTRRSNSTMGTLSDHE